MGEAPSTNLDLRNQTLRRLNKINEIEDYFITEIYEREMMGKRPSKYIATFDYIDKTLIVLSAASGGVSITSFASVVDTPLGIASESSSFAFSLTA